MPPPEYQIWNGDNLTLLRERIADQSIDLIYADPPFNSGKAYFQTGADPARDPAAYDDRWRWTAQTSDELTALDQTLPHSYGVALRALHIALGECSELAYCMMLAPRIAELQRALKPTGSLYLHVDVRMSPYVRLLLDSAFGREQFRNEIAWSYRTGGAGKHQFSRKHDAILFYSASKKYIFHPQYERIRYKKPFFSAKQDEQGYYADVLLRDVWDIPAVINVSAQRTGYPTQKPLELLERIIMASSNEGNLVLDPFCGSGTALVAALRLFRSAIGIDANPAASALSARRCREVAHGSGLSNRDAAV